MDYDVASWVAEEASRGADPRGGAQIPSTAGPKARTPGARFGAPPTPFTPAGAGVGAGEPGAFATEMFLRRVREPGAFPSPSRRRTPPRSRQARSRASPSPRPARRATRLPARLTHPVPRSQPSPAPRTPLPPPGTPPPSARGSPRRSPAPAAPRSPPLPLAPPRPPSPPPRAPSPSPSPSPRIWRRTTPPTRAARSLPSQTWYPA